VNFAGCASFTVREVHELRGIFKDMEDMQVDLVFGEIVGARKINYVYRSSAPIL